MSKFVVVNKAPEKLEAGTIVLSTPNFLEEVVANQKKAPRNHQTAVNHLREILQLISVKYDPDLNAMRIPMVHYVGLPFKGNEDLAAIVARIIKTEHPSTFQRVLECQLKSRPTNTKLIYYVGDSTDCAAFFRAGVDSLDEKDVESYLTGKPKKNAYKGNAITNEEAKNRGTQEE